MTYNHLTILYIYATRTITKSINPNTLIKAYTMVRYPQFLLLAVVLVVNCYRSAANLNTDHSSLIALKSQIQSDPLDLVTRNWSGESSSVCSWMGVTCDSREKRATQLNISNIGLVGTIPPEIGNLSFLVSLDMSENSFQGPIPPSIFNMSWLQIEKLVTIQ